VIEEHPRAAENGSGGTDHGTAAVVMLTAARSRAAGSSPIGAVSPHLRFMKIAV
jgi:hypothetical protein